jgi:uncharacterized protein YndB with AHSA1/START domain
MENKMKAKMQFEFLVDTENNSMTITREFAARRQQVWDCYTKAELLNKWWAPKPLTTKTKDMDFKEGGHWHYAMIDPNGQEYWGKMEYQTTRPIQHLKLLNGFSDESGVMNSEMPIGRWDIAFEDAKDRSIVRIVVAYNSREKLEQVIAMGMQLGMTSAFEGLDDLLLTTKK